MKHIRTPWLFLILLVHGAHAQVLISDSLLLTYTQQDLIAEGVGGASYGVTVHRLIYNTVDPFGEPTIASGAVVLPTAAPCSLSLASYMHGTILDREDVPSRLSNECLVGYFLGGYGYVAALPDYLGLGDSPGQHPYMHAQSEATASIDMLRATREFCAQRGIGLNGQLFLVGYSQGGHTCMATHRMIESLYPEEFQVTASAPCSGPFDASGVQAAVITSDQPYPAPYYLPYVLLSYGRIYPGLFNEVSEVFDAPYDVLLPPLFEGNNGSGAVDDVMPDVPSEIIVDAVLEAFITEADHPFRVALRDNDVYDWTPVSPVRMIYCEADDHVSYRNSVVALDAMQANGATSVSAVSAGASFDHGSCAFPALFAAKAWFDELHTPCTDVGVNDMAEAGWKFWPQPCSDELWIQLPEHFRDGGDWSLYQSDGRVVRRGNYGVAEQQRLDLSGVSAGTYHVELRSAAQRAFRTLVVE